MVTREEEIIGTQAHVGEIAREPLEEGNKEDLGEMPMYLLLTGG